MLEVSPPRQEVYTIRLLFSKGLMSIEFIERWGCTSGAVGMVLDRLTIEGEFGGIFDGAGLLRDGSCR
jgi:hypothetical protein